MNCLCGHFESCEHCRWKPDDPKVLAAMTREDWGRSIKVEIHPDPMLEKLQAIRRGFRGQL